MRIEYSHTFNAVNAPQPLPYADVPWMGLALKLIGVTGSMQAFDWLLVS